MGLWEIPSHEKFIPSEYLEAQRVGSPCLLQGLLDTDGWVERWGSVRFATTSPTLAAQVAELVRSLGGWCTTSERTPKYTYKGEKRAGRRGVHAVHFAPQRADAVFLRRARSSARSKRGRIAEAAHDSLDRSEPGG